MKKVYLYLSIIAILIFAWLFVTKPIGYEQVYISFYCIFISFVIYFMFSKFSKSLNITNTYSLQPDFTVDFQLFYKGFKKLWSYWIFIIILFLGTLILVTKDTHGIPQNAATLLFNTSIIFLIFLFTVLLNKPKIIAINNLPAFFNMIILLPLIFKNKSNVLEMIFNNSIFNSLINAENRPHTILYSLLLISLFIFLIKYLAKKRIIKSS